MKQMPRPKVRRQWQISPVQRVKQSKKLYSRREARISERRWSE